MKTTLPADAATTILKNAKDRLGEIERATISLRKALEVLESGKLPAGATARDIGTTSGGSTPIPH
ncbi:MAG: hypothetical protein ABI699_15385 [Caldimonas sp.]